MVLCVCKYVDNYYITSVQLLVKLGMLVNTKKTFVKHFERINLLLMKCRTITHISQLFCLLFKSFCDFKLTHCAEIWGLLKSKEIERKHLKICKGILNTRKRTCDVIVHAELEQYRLSCFNLCIHCSFLITSELF